MNDFESFLDSSVMFRLPDTVKDDQEISVIIRLDQADIMSAYEKTDKSMSFAEFALSSEKAAAIRAEIQSEKARILAALDQQDISYKTGDDYANVLSGFDIQDEKAYLRDGCILICKKCMEEHSVYVEDYIE